MWLVLWLVPNLSTTVLSIGFEVEYDKLPAAQKYNYCVIAVQELEVSLKKFKEDKNSTFTKKDIDNVQNNLLLFSKECAKLKTEAGL